MSDRPLRHCIVGTGFMATVHSRAVRRAGGIVTVVAGGTPENAQAAVASAVLPAGHPQGYQDSFDSFVADVTRRVRGEQGLGLPTFADGARAARITDAVVRSSRTRTWVEVPA